ncbi:hypothetical protein FB45DRAFT_913994 [Roridomyces roridus]|uniref:Uncharacterized protein n=1 Tax=Roridomyces roridus TaxID=1738132 RepID=A0AAD7BYJ8_9AGAR|nr:hypothetical protein FB45DRAFT_913994 [Roridomyces roridus]
MSNSIKDLLDKPFGPYPDWLILNPAFVKGGTSLPRLRNLRLVQNNKFIGLDTSEQYLTAPTKPSEPVHFLGVLLIEKLEWLSEAGLEFLTKDLNDRDGARQSRKSGSKQAPLKLTGIYGQIPARGFRIKVWVQCLKEVPAMFMTDDRYPKSLLLGSRDKRRTYEILSIDRHIHDRSRKFLQRYQLIALIKEILHKHRDDETGRHPLGVETLVAAYRIKHQDENLSHSVLFAKDPPPAPHVRHVSRAEVRAAIAAHAEWILAFYLCPHKSCPLDVIDWCTFIRGVWRARASGAQGMPRNWGRTYSRETTPKFDPDDPTAISEALAAFGETPDVWQKRLDHALTRKTSSTSTAFHLFDDEMHSVPQRLVYDPDFSEPSTPGETSSESESDLETLPLPRIIYKPPTLLPGRFIWDCPVARCNHSVDLLHWGLQETLEDIVVHKHQYSNLSDEQVQNLLFRLVADHYFEHLVRTTKYESKAQFRAEMAKRWKR